MDELVFTPSAVLGLLTSLEELADKEISFIEKENSIDISIGNNTYNVKTGQATDVEVSDAGLESVAEANDEGYAELEELGDLEFDDEPIEGGIIKELVKTLYVGGLVRLTSDAIKKS